MNLWDVVILEFNVHTAFLNVTINGTIAIQERAVLVMEELLQQILARLAVMEKGQAAMQKSQEEMKQSQAAMQKDQEEMKQSQQQTLERIENLEGQMKENTDIIKAIQHNTEVLNAKIDGLVITTASKDAVALLDAKFDVLNHRLFQQEADLQLLKKAQ